MTKLDDLKTVDPSNLAIQSTHHRSSKEQMSNFSTERVVETPAFDTQQLSMACQAQAGMDEHLNFAAAVTGMDPLRQLRQDLTPYANQLTTFKLPDTVVSIDNQKIEIPYDVKQHGNDFDPKTYNDTVGALIGKKRLRALRGYMTRSNQAHTPGLWLGQAVWIETKKPYVYLLGREEESREQMEKNKLNDISPELAETASGYLQLLLGAQLFTAIKQIGTVTHLPVYVVFVLIVDAIIMRLDKVSKPVTTESTWAAAEGEDDES